MDPSIEIPRQSPFPEGVAAAVLTRSGRAGCLSRGRALGARLMLRAGLGLEWVIGALTLIVALAVLAVVPLLNLLSLGYLLEAAGRVARTGKLREGFIGVRKAAAFGRVIFGLWLIWWPIRFCSGLWQDAELIARGSSVAAGWRWGLLALSVLLVWHATWACLRGGKLRHFLWPAPIRFIRWLRAGGRLDGLSTAIGEHLRGWRLGYYFGLGWTGFVGGVLWLAVPVGLLVAAAHLPPAGAAVVGLAGGCLLFLVSLYLPFLQTLAAAEGRFAAMLDVRRVRQLFGRAPIAFGVGLTVTLLFAIPLYLLKIEFPPREIAWLPSLLFVVFIFPARLLTGWAVGRGLRQEQPRHGFWRWTSRLGLVPVVGFYVLAVYLTQYLSWHGVLSLIEQHAFLVPAPMLSL